MNNNKISFITLYKDKYLRKKIFSFLNSYNTICKKYKDIYYVDWIITQRYWGLLKDKLKRGDHLILVPESGRFLFSIKDVELFAMCFSRFQQDYFPLHHYPPIFNYVAQFNNLAVLKYLVETFNGAYGGDYVALEFSAQYGNLEMLKYLVEQVGIQQISPNCFVQAVKNGDRELIEYVKSKMGEFTGAALEINSLIDYAQSSLDLFQYIVKELDIDGFVTSFYLKALKNIEIFKYIMESFEKPSDFSLKDCCLECANNNYIDSLEYLLMNQDKTNESIDLNEIGKTLLVQGFIDGFKHIFNDRQQCSIDLSNTNFSDIKNSCTSLDRVTYYSELGVKVSTKCLVDLPFYGMEVFEFIWLNRCSNQIVNQNQRLFYKGQDITFGLVENSILANNIKILLYINENYDVRLGITSSGADNETPLTAAAAGVNKNSLYIINTRDQVFLKTILEIINADYIDLISLLKACARENASELTIQYLHKQLQNKVNPRMIDAKYFERIDQIFIICAKYNNIGMVENLIEAGMKPSNLIIELISPFPCLEIIRYLLNKGYQPTRSSLVYPYQNGYLDIIKLIDQHTGEKNLGHQNLTAATRYNQFKCVKYFLKDFNHVTITESIATNIVTSLAYCPNLKIVEYSISFLKTIPIPMRYHNVFYCALTQGYIDIIKFLLSNDYIKLSDITEPLFRAVYFSRHTHLLIYLYDKVPLTYYMNLTGRYAPSEFLQFVEDLKHNKVPIVHNKSIGTFGTNIKKYLSKLNVLDLIQIFNFDQ